MQTVRHGEMHLHANLSPLPWQLHLLIISDSPSFVSQTHLRQKKRGKKRKNTASQSKLEMLGEGRENKK